MRDTPGNPSGYSQIFAKSTIVQPSDIMSECQISRPGKGRATTQGKEAAQMKNQVTVKMIGMELWIEREIEDGAFSVLEVRKIEKDTMEQDFESALERAAELETL